MERLWGESKVRERSSELWKDSELQAASSDLQWKDSELQKESELRSTRGELEEGCQHIEVAEATLGSERTTFENAKERFEDDLNQALTAKDAVEARVRVVTDQCQWEMKVFKFKKYKNEYEDGKRGRP